MSSATAIREKNSLFVKHLPELFKTFLELLPVLAYRRIYFPYELKDLKNQFDAKIMSGKALDEQEREQYAQIETMLSEYNIQENNFQKRLEEGAQMLV